MPQFSKPGVRPCADFLRIRALKTRGDESYPPRLVDEMTRLLKTSTGTQTLLETQAKALFDFGTNKAGFFPIKVGGGKTLVTLLAPRLVEARRPLLLVPGGLLTKTVREWHAAAKHWMVSKHLQIKSYDFISRVSGASYLDLYLPDLIIADEAHRLKNPRAAVTRRLKRYIEAKVPIFVPLSGTIMKDSIKNFAHLLAWSHREGAPVPLGAEAITEWSEALDENANAFTMRPPGVLTELFPGAVPESEIFEDDRARARRVFQKRLVATPGIILADSKEDFTGSLNIKAIEYTPNQKTEDNFGILRREMCRPDGWALSEAMQVWAVARQLAIGLHYTWDPLPPQEWLDARKQWAQYVRDILSKPAAMRAGLDTEFQVMTAVLGGQLEDEYGILDHWRKIKPTFEVNSVEVWHDDTALLICQDWLKKHPKGICWVAHNLFARELSKRAGCPYFGAGGLDSKGNYIEDAAGPIIASIEANRTGRNLQFKWCENLVTAPAPDSETMEQLAARTHRRGQPEDEVNIDILVGCREHLESIPRALSSADVKNQLLGFEQKLRVANVDWPDESASRRGMRWA